MPETPEAATSETPPSDTDFPSQPAAADAAGRAEQSELDANGAEPDMAAVADASDNGEAARRGRRQFIRLAAISAVVIGAVGAALVMALGGGDAQRTVTAPVEPAGVLVALPPMLFDLQPSKTRPHFLRLALSLEVAHDDRQKVQDAEARIVDAIKSVLRDYRYEDLVGTTGTERIRGDILIVARRAAAPARVRNVLFAEFLLD